jgi:hypothetical protein
MAELPTPDNVNNADGEQVGLPGKRDEPQALPGAERLPRPFRLGGPRQGGPDGACVSAPSTPPQNPPVGPGPGRLQFRSETIATLGDELLHVTACEGNSQVWNGYFPNPAEAGFVEACADLAGRVGWGVSRAEQELAPIFTAAQQQFAAARTRPEAEAAPTFLSGVVPSAKFAAAEYHRDWLVRPLFVRDEPIIFGGPKKSLKTSLVADLALSLGSARKFLGKFEVARRVRTLVLSGESGQATLQETAQRICRQKRLRLEDCDVLWGFELPALSCVDELAVLEEYLRDTQIKVVIIDPLYLCLMRPGTNVSPTNLFEIGPLLLNACTACRNAGATPVLVHHAKKQSTQHRVGRYEPLELEDPAYSGFGEFARQWMLVTRRERYDPDTGVHKLWFEVGGSAGQGGRWGVDVCEGRIGDDFQGRTWDVQVRSAKETMEEAAHRNAEKGAARKEKEESEARQFARREVLRLLRLNRDGLTLNDVKDKAKCKKTLLKETLARLEEDGRIEPAKIPKPGGKAVSRDYPAYKLTDQWASHSDWSEGGSEGEVQRLGFGSRASSSEERGAATADGGPPGSASAGLAPEGQAPDVEGVGPSAGETTKETGLM